MQPNSFTRYSLSTASAALAALATVFPALAAAQSCKNPDAQMAINVCAAARDDQRDDKRLNQTYRDLVAKLEQGDRS